MDICSFISENFGFLFHFPSLFPSIFVFKKRLVAKVGEESWEMWWGKPVSQISDKNSTICPQFHLQLKTLEIIHVEKGAPFQFIYTHIFPFSTTHIRASNPRLTWSQQRYLAIHLWGCSGEVSQDTLLIPVTVPPRLGWASVLPCLNREGERSAGVAVPLEMEEAVLQHRGRGREPRFLAFRARTRSIGDISGGLLQVARDNLWSWHHPLRVSKPGILSLPCL